MVKKSLFDGDRHLQVVQNYCDLLKELMTTDGCRIAIENDMRQTLWRGKDAMGTFASGLDLLDFAATEKSLKRSSIYSELVEEGFTPVENRGDGNCLLESVGHGLYGNEWNSDAKNNALILRGTAILWVLVFICERKVDKFVASNWMERELDILPSQPGGGDSKEMRWLMECKRVCVNNIWGNAILMKGLANAFYCDIALMWPPELSNSLEPMWNCVEYCVDLRVPSLYRRAVIVMWVVHKSDATGLRNFIADSDAKQHRQPKINAMKTRFCRDTSVFNHFIWVHHDMVNSFIRMDWKPRVLLMFGDCKRRICHNAGNTNFFDPAPKNCFGSREDFVAMASSSFSKAKVNFLGSCRDTDFQCETAPSRGANFQLKIKLVRNRETLWKLLELVIAELDVYASSLWLKQNLEFEVELSPSFFVWKKQHHCDPRQFYRCLYSCTETATKIQAHRMDKYEQGTIMELSTGGVNGIFLLYIWVRAEFSNIVHCQANWQTSTLLFFTQLERVLKQTLLMMRVENGSLMSG